MPELESALAPYDDAWTRTRRRGARPCRTRALTRRRSCCELHRLRSRVRRRVSVAGDECQTPRRVDQDHAGCRNRGRRAGGTTSFERGCVAATWLRVCTSTRIFPLTEFVLDVPGAATELDGGNHPAASNTASAPPLSSDTNTCRSIGSWSGTVRVAACRGAPGRCNCGSSTAALASMADAYTQNGSDTASLRGRQVPRSPATPHASDIEHEAGPRSYERPRVCGSLGSRLV